MKIEDEAKKGPIHMSNGAVITLNVDDCEVCVSKGEEPEPGIFAVEYGDQTVNVCKSHGQKLLDDMFNRKEEGPLFKEVFGFDNV